MLDLNSGKYVVALPEATGLKPEATAALGKRLRALLSKLPAEKRHAIGPEIERRLKKAIPKGAPPDADKLGRVFQEFFVRGPAHLVTLPETVSEAILDRTRLRQGLFTAAVTYFEDHFDAVERGRPLLQRLAGNDPERWRTYVLLVGRSREQQGKYIEAAKAYADFYSLNADCAMMSVPGELGLRVVPSAWLQGRIEALLRQAPKEQHRQIRREVARRLMRGIPKRSVKDHAPD